MTGKKNKIHQLTKNRRRRLMIKQNVGDGLAHPVGLARHEILFQNLNFQI